MPERRKKNNLSSAKHAATRQKTSAAKASAKKAKGAPTKKTAKAPVQAAAPKDHAVSVYDLNGKALESVTLDSIFHDEPVNKDVIYQTVLMYRAGERGGNAATKTRGEVRGGGKKPWKQKGTGRARHASVRSPIWRGGGTVFGPHPRDYSYTIPREIRRKAVLEGVKDKVANGKFWLLKDLELEAPKTKLMSGVVTRFKWVKPLFVVDKKTNNVTLASRNLGHVLIKVAEEVNALDVVSSKECVVTKAAYSGLLKRFKS